MEKKENKLNEDKIFLISMVINFIAGFIFFYLLYYKNMISDLYHFAILGVPPLIWLLAKIDSIIRKRIDNYKETVYCLIIFVLFRLLFLFAWINFLVLAIKGGNI